MFNDKRLFEYGQAQSQITSDYTKKAQAAFISYQQDLEKIATEAGNKARLLLENYYGELRAASLGDDSMERASAAWMSYQQEYAQINDAYLTSCQERYQTFVDTIQDLQLTAGTQALSGYMELLEEAKKELLANTKKASDKPKKSGSGSTKNT